MSKYSAPGIYFNEIDNTVRNDTTVGLGRGAIVFNANRGYVNQRILTNSYSDFEEQFGEPVDETNMGHFAAREFFANGSTQMLGIRATMGDERYAFIQYPLEESVTNKIDEQEDRTKEQLQFVDSDGNHQLHIVKSLSSEQASALEKDGWNLKATAPEGYFYVNDTAKFGEFVDLYNENMPVKIVYRDTDLSDATKAPSGKFFKFPTSRSMNKFNKFIVTVENLKLTNTKKSGLSKDNTFTIYAETESKYQEKSTNATPGSANTVYCRVVINISASKSLNGKPIQASCFVDKTALFEKEKEKDTIDLGALVAKINCPDAYRSSTEAVKLVVENWADGLASSTYYVKKADFSSPKSVKSIEFREYNHGDTSFVMVNGDEKITVTSCEVKTSSKSDTSTGTGSASDGSSSGNTGKDGTGEKNGSTSGGATTEPSKPTESGEDEKVAKIQKIAAEYGLTYTEIASKKFAIIEYVDLDGEKIEVLVYTDDTFADGDVKCYNAYPHLFIAYLDDNGNVETKAVYGNKEPKPIYIPWRVGDEDVEAMVARSTQEVLTDVDSRWADGYTPTKTADEPGNGDIETYIGKAGNLVIAGLAPGDYLNRVGIAIITPAAAQIPAMQSADLFSWKYAYDDEDQVDTASNDYLSNDENLTWKKVYKINVYLRGEDKSEAAWGTGLASMKLAPIESWLVSNDPAAKDAAGNSLYAPVVINGHSNYIYIAESSVKTAENGINANKIKQYAMPIQTFSVYSLRGGQNSQMNEVKQKTAALKLYQDPEKAHFDIIFNVEPITSFTGRQKFKALQDKIAQIAITRGRDLAFIQCSSLEAKTANAVKSEGKTFKYANGSYVAGYAGYDKYYDDTTASWISMPKSVAGACAEVYTQVYVAPWYAPAGVDRGLISYTNGSSPKLSQKEIGDIYDLNINTSTNKQGFGEVLMTQKNFLKKESALNRIDIRALVNYIEVSLDVLLLPFLFKKGSAATLESLKSTVTGLLKQIQAGEGIEQFSVTVKKDVEDPRLVYVNIFFIPIESIEFIEVNLNINRGTGSIEYTENG